MPNNVAKDLVIRDIMFNQGKILTLSDTEGKFQISLDILAYNTLTNAIPQAWKEKLKNCPIHISPILS